MSQRLRLFRVEVVVVADLLGRDYSALHVAHSPNIAVPSSLGAYYDSDRVLRRLKRTIEKAKIRSVRISGNRAVLDDSGQPADG